MNLAARLWLSVAVTVLVGAVVVVADVVTSASLRDPRFLTGWILFGLMLALAAFNARKKLPFLPLGSAAGWLRFHVYAGWLSFVVFFLHVGLRLPQGPLEVSLAALYLLVALSGVAGLTISRVFPKRLSRNDDELIFERMPVLLKRLRDECDEQILESMAKVESTTVAEFYTSRVRPFLDRPRNLVQHLFEWKSAHHAMRGHFDVVRRYLDEDEKKTLGWLYDHVRRKENLDYAYALQATLKIWLFVHVPLTYSMLLLTLVHVILVYAFTGGIS